MAPPRTRANKVTKPVANTRRDTRRSAFSSVAAQEQLGNFVYSPHLTTSTLSCDGLSEAIRQGREQADIFGSIMVAHPRGSNHWMQDHIFRQPIADSTNSSFTSMTSDNSSPIPQPLPMETSHSQQSHLSSHPGSFEIPHLTIPPQTPQLVNSVPLHAPRPSTNQTAAREVAFKWHSGRLKIDSAVCQRLGDEAAKREPTQRRSYQKLNLERRSNVEALLAHITGDEPPQPCKNCHKGHGPWKTCVVKEGQLCGSCTNCWFNASGSRCTYHGK